MLESQAVISVLTPFILLSLITAGSYENQIMELRSKRDAVFADPIKSPLATSAIVLLSKDRTVFGRSADSDLVWEAPGIASHHLEILRRDDEIQFKRLNGEVFRYPERSPVNSGLWKVQEYLWAGPILLVLQMHPVGPVLRVVDPQSPERSSFKGLTYFPVDPSFNVKGSVTPYDQPKPLKILDTQGWERPAWIFGKVYFHLDGEEQSLDLILFEEKPSEESSFMILFRDGTTGKETYPACRYLLIPYQQKGEIWLDFNKAFNPSCAYGNGFACPLPPPGNRLKSNVRAGEMNYPRAH